VGQKNLDQLVEKIKHAGRNKKHDCVVGVSGGADSTYLLHMANKLGLRPLAFHFDNGWDTEIALNNARNVTAKLGVDLRMVSVDWEEYRDLQLSFLKASVSDAEIPTDLGIIASSYRVAAEENIRYVLNGHSFRVEGIDPLRWTYMDGRYINSVHKIFGGKRLRNFPNLTISNLFYYALIKRIRFVPLLAYINYNKEDSKGVLKEKLGWVDYGSHHFESVYTRFIIYHRWKKFGIDGRVIEYSAHIRSGQMTRDEALQKLVGNPIVEDEQIVKYCLDKLGVNQDEFQQILSLPPKTFLDYSTYYPVIRAFKIPIRVACNLRILPEIFYEKYFNC
jgi:N-acetyl sugar amidotransferase